MKVVISRTYGNSETKGALYIFEGCQVLFHCVTLELPDNGNQHNTSCIPEGVYDVIKIIRPNGDKAFHVLSVPWRENILIHKGNYTGDTLGCILPGVNFVDLNADDMIDVDQSTKTMIKLLAILPQKFKLIIV